MDNAIYVSEYSSLVLNMPDDNSYSGYPTNDIYNESAKYIVYEEISGLFSGDIRHVLLDGTQSMPIVSSFGVASGPAWSPDGSTIAFSYLELNPLDLNSEDYASSYISVVDRYWIESSDQDIPDLHIDIRQAAGFERDLPTDKWLLSRKRFPQNLLFANSIYRKGIYLLKTYPYL